MTTEREKFIILVDNDTIKKSDAIILLEGDGYFRIDHAVDLFKRGMADRLVVSGGIEDRAYGSFPASELAKRITDLGISDDKLIIDDQSSNTREQAINILAMAEKNSWRRIILVGSHYHQYRAYLTFLKVLEETGSEVMIFNSPARTLPWFSANEWGKRFELIDQEFDRIDAYREKGHIAAYQFAIDYQRRKEDQK